jgi:hypothetical protein
VIIFLRALLILLLCPLVVLAEDLPSWNEGKSRQSIVDFVTKVTTEGGEGFIQPEDRIAVRMH